MSDFSRDGSRDRRPPYSEDAEQAVLAAMLIDQTAILTAVEVLDDTMFYAEKHRRLFRAMVTLTEVGTVVDPLTLANELGRTSDLEGAGGKDYIGFLVDAVPTADNVRYHAGIVREKAMLRRLIETAGELQREAFLAERDARELAQQASAALLPVSITDVASTGFILVKHSLYAVIEEIEARANGATGLLTGYADIDRETGGFRPGELIIPAGAEKMGKSAFVLNVAMNVAERAVADGGGTVGYVSAEMTREQLVERCLGILARLDGKLLATGKLVDTDWPRLARASGLLGAMALHIDDEAEPSLADVVARCTHLKATHPDLRLLVVDFLQLVHDREKGVNESIELKRIAYALKAMAKRLRVVVMAPCQVNTKDVEKTKAEPKPELKDLQGSSGMRQAADFVGLIFRPGAYEGLDAEPDLMEINFAACRRTARFRVRLRWDDTSLAIRNWGPQ